MSSESQPNSQQSSSRDRLPFEPSKSRKTAEKKAPVEPKAQTVKSAKDQKTDEAGRPSLEESTAIPEVVSRRMVWRMALFCGIPSSLGISTFFVSYFLLTKNLASLPNSAVVLLSMGFLGLGVLGLTYGVLSASWDEEIPGSRLGWSEFTTNFGRMTAAWRSTGRKS